MKKLIFNILTYILLLIPISVNASNYEINNYEIEIETNRKQHYTIRENIESNILENTTIVREFDININNLNIDANYITETSDKKVIKINTLNNTDKVYNFKYEIKKDNTEKDIYSYDIKNNFNTTINNISFRYTLPEDFNKNNISFYLNNKKIKDIEYKIDKNTIIGTYKLLNEKDILTIKVDYQAIYLTKSTLVAIIIPILLSIIGFICWYIYGKDLKYKVKRTSTLPDSLIPLEISLINRGFAYDKDLIATLLDLSNRGYIKIEESNINDFTLTRIKDYEEKNYKEASFLRALFKKSNSITLSEYVNCISTKKSKSSSELEKTITKDNLYNSFRRVSSNILPLLNNKDEKNKYFEKSSETNQLILVFMLAVILILVTSLPFIEVNKAYLLPISVLVSISILYILLGYVDISNNKLPSSKLLLLIILSIIIVTIMLLPSFYRNRIYIVAFIISCICIGIILLLYKYMPKRTILGTKHYSKIEGFKKYLSTLEKDEVQKELKDNNNYLYDLLPYAYALDMEKYIIDLIKELDISGPSWYKVKDKFTPVKFKNSLNRLYENIKLKSEE